MIRFYQGAEIPIWQMATAGAIEGGDVMIVEPGCVVIGNGEDRTERPAAKQLAAYFEAEGWEARVEPIPGIFVHIDVLMAIVAPKLAAVCTDIVSGSLVRWLEGKGFEILPVPEEDAFALGVNAMSLGDGRVLTGAGAQVAERADGGARPRAARPGSRDVHSRWRRRALPGAGDPARPCGLTAAGQIDADRVIADLRELARRTSDEGGSQRVAWTQTWHDARAFLGELLDEIGAVSETDRGREPLGASGRRRRTASPSRSDRTSTPFPTEAGSTAPWA